MNSIASIVVERCTRYGEGTALRFKSEGRYKNVSWNDLKNNIEKVAMFFDRMNFVKGDRIAIISENRPEWVYIDAAALSLGLIDVPIYPSSTNSQVQFVLSDSACKSVFVSNSMQLEKVLAVWNKCPNLEYIICSDRCELVGRNILYFDEILNTDIPYGWSSFLREKINTINLDDVATIIYTSGTTAEPKGVVLSHGNIISNCMALLESKHGLDNTETFMSVLPLSHMFERTAGYYCAMFLGSTIAYSEGTEKVADNLVETSPTVVCVVPRIPEKVYCRIRDNFYKGFRFKRRIFSWIEDISEQYTDTVVSGRPLGCRLGFLHWLLDKFLFCKLRKKLGGRIKLLVSGGAPLSEKVAKFFYSAGIMIIEGYGMTETSPVISLNLPGKFKFGSVGTVLNNLQCKVCDDGEIKVKGPSVMSGYFNNPEETKKVFDSDGWLCTGDLGAFDEKGFLRILDRKKEIIITSNGKNIYPALIENELCNSRFIEQVCLVGEKKNFISALVVPRFNVLKKQDHSHKKLHELIANDIEAVNNGLANFERIKKFRILNDPFKIENDELTPTLKYKRRVIYERYKDLIEEMYA